MSKQASYTLGACGARAARIGALLTLAFAATGVAQAQQSPEQSCSTSVHGKLPQGPLLAAGSPNHG